MQRVSTNNHRSDYCHVRVRRSVSSSRYIIVAIGRTALSAQALLPLPLEKAVANQFRIYKRSLVKINPPAVICFGRWRFVAAPWHAIKQPTLRESLFQSAEKGRKELVSPLLASRVPRRCKFSHFYVLAVAAPTVERVLVVSICVLCERRHFCFEICHLSVGSFVG